MGLFENWPYTNLHELNLDWLLSQMRSLQGDVSAYKTETDQLINELTGLDTATMNQLLSKIQEIEDYNLMSNNIKDWGATGNRERCNTYINDMIAAGLKSIYFPAGEYAFENYDIAGLSSIKLYGEGTIYNTVNNTTGQLNYSFKFNQCQVVIIEGLTFRSDVPFNTTGQTYKKRVAQLRFFECANVMISQCRFGGAYRWYKESPSISATPFHEREGVIVTWRDCTYVNFNQNVVSEYYSNAMWYSSWNLSEAYATFHDNIYRQHTAGNPGSPLDALWGNINFYNNTVEESFALQGESLFNLFGKNVLIHDNVICTSQASGFDTTESGRVANRNVICVNNSQYWTTNNINTISTFLIANADNMICANNIANCTIGIKLRNQTGVSNLDNKYSTHPDPAGTALITDNIFNVKDIDNTLSNITSQSNAICIYQTWYDKLIIKNNTFKNPLVTPINIAGLFNSITINDNDIEPGYYNNALTNPVFIRFAYTFGSQPVPATITKTGIILIKDNIMNANKNYNNTIAMSVTTSQYYDTDWGTWFIIDNNINTNLTQAITSEYTGGTHNEIIRNNIWDIPNYTP